MLASSRKSFARASTLLAFLSTLWLQPVRAEEELVPQVAIDLESSITIDLDVEEPKKATGFLSTTESDQELEHNTTAEPVDVPEGSAMFGSDDDTFVTMAFIVFGIIFAVAVIMGIACTICALARGEGSVYYIRRRSSSSMCGIEPQVCQAPMRHSTHCHSSAGCPVGWQEDALCDGHRAAERASWLQANEGMSAWAAQQRVMNEFAHVFGAAASAASETLAWRGDAMCDGRRAGDRAAWLESNEGLSTWAARQRVMNEFPNVFGAAASAASSTRVASGTRVWRNDAMCAGTRAADRAEWLKANEGLSTSAAQQRVMNEFPNVFGPVPGWRPHAMCGGHLASNRAQLLEFSLNISAAEAQRRVMSDYPHAFR